ncbi:hypothetical protein G7068_03605 [Leucobacter viscericola]|uniref:Uncharacterized protein n=1 Tax=Leucobacter viscericola TaxID=2714935 RepID=A0A6G7XDE5_9MICO|nr:hypothetical protein [Leucobacter viscericola]QIK62398.1 hypothetical protein G7068_03605 [Leucobacter viscericola]
MSQATPQLSRAHRVARGGAGAAVATLLAAASHGLAGGTITWLAVIATGLVAMPLCTALAGRVGSLWRLSLAVVAAQFLYHWSFAGLGITGAGTTGVTPESAHASHLAALQAFTPSVTAASADATMWALHAVAALVTIGLVYRGERAFLALMGMLRQVFALPAVALVEISHRAFAVAERPLATRIGERLFAAVSHRGPPLCA